MAGKSGSASSSPLAAPLPPQVVVVAALLVIAVIGWVAYRAFGPIAQPPTFTVSDQKAWVADLARKSGGDFSRLGPAEQKRLDAISLGNGARMLRSAYERRK